MEETLDPNFSPSKRLKSETLTLDSQISQSKCKGKAPIIDSDDEFHPQNCGICLSDEGKSVRGLIDSCDHYFCFLCVIEWSKIESRCPLCRARFTGIRRMRKDGSIIGDGSVRVPVRDQIYDPFGEPAADPYAQVKCTVCDGTTDESLLLLCDLCDSAWHTYCVGLGYTVPEGDWYCRDCTLLRAEQCDGERDDNVENSNISKDDDAAASTPTAVSIFDIVRDEESDSSVDRLLKLVSAPTRPCSSMIASDQANGASSGSLQDSRGSLKPPVDVMDSSARTLHNCRNVHRHISVLRENWDAFRGGSLSFSTSSRDFSRKDHQKKKVVTSNRQWKAHDTLCKPEPDEKPYNVDKAWKLMNIARSMQRVGLQKGASKTTLGKARGSKADNDTSNSETFRSKDQVFLRPKVQMQCNNVNGKGCLRSKRPELYGRITENGSNSADKYPGASISSLFSSGKVRTVPQEKVSHNRLGVDSQRTIHGGLPTSMDVGSASKSLHGPISGAVNAACNDFKRKETLACLKKGVGNASEPEIQSSGQRDLCHDRAGPTSQQNPGVLPKSYAYAFDEQKGSACAKPPYEPVTSASHGSHVKLQGGETSVCPTENGAQTTKERRSDEAKGEIQSLVKLNLKLLTKDKRLGADAFKEIARISTHTILAACGFEHRKIAHSYKTLICHHVDQTPQPPRCTLMPSSCRECFYLFVKNVVGSIMSEKSNGVGVAH